MATWTGRNRGETLKEVVMTRLFKLFSVRLLSLGGAKASTLGLEGKVEEDDITRFNP